MSSTVRAVLTDPESTVVLGERSLRAPGANEAVVRVRCLSLNRGELGIAVRKPAGTAIGWDIAGELETSPDPERLPVGTRVVGFSRAQEGWAERTVLPISDLAPIPDGVSFEQAAALPVAAGTALLSLDAMPANLLGRAVLITGVTGGVGGYAVALARLAGAEVTAQVRRDEQVEYARKLGADAVVVSPNGDNLGGPYELVVDGVGGTLLDRALTTLTADGLAVSYGITDGAPPVQAATLMGKGRASLRGFNLYASSDETPPAKWLARLLSLVERDRLRGELVERGSWSQIQQAAADLLARRFTGKAVLRVD